MEITPLPLLFRCACLCLAVLAFSNRVNAAPSETPDDDGWRALLERRFNEAGPAFSRALERSPGERTMVVGQAVALLAKQPRTRANVAEAEALLGAIETGADDTALVARFLRARVAEVHRFEPDHALAASRYEALITAAPAHTLAQAAVVKLARLKIYFIAEDPVAALAEAETMESGLKDSAARRDYHLMMARSLIFFDQDRRRALAHLREAERAGFSIAGNEADVLVAIGQLARELGDAALARESFNRFLERHPRDQRRYFVQTLLETIPAGEGTKP